MIRKYLIANHVIAMEHTAPEAARAMEPYRYEGAREPERVFAVAPDALRQAGEEWLALYRAEIEEYMLSRQFCAWLAARDGMYLHAAAVAYRGCAYAFTADPGTGKSTHAHLWRQALGAEILNDDKPFLCRRDGAFFVCGSPWCGKEGLTANREAPLTGLCFLEQGDCNAIERVAPRDAVARLLRQTLLPERPQELERLLSFVDELVRTVPLYRLRCTISEEAARLAYAAMRPDETEDA